MQKYSEWSEHPEHVLHIFNLKYLKVPNDENIFANFLLVGLAQRRIEDNLEYSDVHSKEI